MDRGSFKYTILFWMNITNNDNQFKLLCIPSPIHLYQNEEREKCSILSKLSKCKMLLE